MNSLKSRVAAFAVASLFVTPALAQGVADRGWWMMSDWGWDHVAYGGLMMVVFWGGIVLFVVLLARGFGSGGRPDASPPIRQSPSDILQERYARGEIDKQEYDERRQVLSDSR